MRELTQVEYQYLWSGLHRNGKHFEQFLIDYNLAVPKHRQINFHRRVKLGFTQIVIYREELPHHMQRQLDQYEDTLPHPFIGGAFKNVHPITAGVRP